MAKMMIKSECRVATELEDLVTDLKSTLITKRLKAVKALGKLKTPLAVDPLREMLNDRSRDVRCSAIEALGQMKPGNLAELLLPYCTDRSADVRLRVAHALGESGSDEAIRALFELIRDPKDDVAGMAARCLSKYPRKTLAPLVRAFGDKSWKIRSRSATAVQRMGRSAAEALKAGLAETDANIRYWSALSLGKLKNRANIPDLLGLLGDGNVGVRIAALRALREIGDPTVVNKLFEALSQPSEQVRDIIFDILKDFGTHSIPFLMESLSNEYWMGRSLAARALSEMGSDAIAPLTAALEGQDKERRFWAIKILGQMREASALPEIEKFLADPDGEIRMATIQALADYLHPETIPALIERFLDPNWAVRREAFRTVIRFGDVATGPLLKALDSPEDDIRYWSLRSLGDIRPRSAFPRLIKALRDPSWNIRKTAAEVLARFGEEALLELTNLATEADSETRYWVLQALGAIGSQISLPLLFRSLEDPAESIRTAAQRGLANYGIQILDDLLSMLKSDNRRLLESVVQVFRRMPFESVVPRLVQSLGKFDDHVCYWLRRSLREFPVQARPSIRGLLDSKANEVRRQAILTLGQIGETGDAEEVVRHLKDEYWPCRVAAAETLGMLGNPLSIEGLMEALEDDDEDLALASARALGAIGDDRAVPALLTALSRESWTIRFQVITILGQMKVRRAVPDLLKMLDEDTLDLKVPIIRALGAIAHPDSLKQVRDRFGRETDPEARLAYIEAFGNLRSLAVVPELIDLLKPERPWDERRLAIRTLGQLKATDAKAPLLEVLRDSDPFLNREAMTSLKLVMPADEYQAMEQKIIAHRQRQDAFARHFQEGMKAMRVNAMVDAERELKAALKINPKAGYVYSALGNLYYKTGKLIDATKAYVMAVTVEPRDITLRLNLGMVYYRRRAYKEALETFRGLVKLCDPRGQQGQYAAKMIEKITLEAKQAIPQ